MGDSQTGISALRNRLCEAALAVLMLASAALLLYFRSSLNFVLDDWAFVIYREDGGVTDFLEPHNEHISILPVAIYKLFLSVFGMTSAMPLHVFSVAIFLLSVFVLFLYLKPLVGKPAAVVGCAVVLFFGAAWEDLLWAFQLGFSISIAAGIGALIALQRQDGFGDRIACLLLVISVISTSLGIPLAIGAGVLLLLQREDLIRRLYVVVVPAVVYVLWYFGWGHTAENAISIDNVLNTPEYIARSFSLTVTEVTGLSRVIKSPEVTPSLLVGLIAVVAVAFGVRQRVRIPRPLLVAIAIATAFWGLATLNVAPGRGFEASRYQFPNAVFLLMILAGAFEGARPRARELTALGMIALAGIVVNIDALRDGYRDFFRPLSDYSLARLTGLELAGDKADPEYSVALDPAGFQQISAGKYLEMRNRYGSAGLSPGELQSAPENSRIAVDTILVQALPLELRTVSGPAGPDCVRVEVTPTGRTGIAMLPGSSFTVRPSNDVAISFGRFSNDTPVVAGEAPAGRFTRVGIPTDESGVLWRLGIAGVGAARVCAGPAR